MKNIVFGLFALLLPIREAHATPPDWEFLYDYNDKQTGPTEVFLGVTLPYPNKVLQYETLVNFGKPLTLRGKTYRSYMTVEHVNCRPPYLSKRITLMFLVDQMGKYDGGFEPIWQENDWQSPSWTHNVLKDNAYAKLMATICEKHDD